MTKTKKLGAVMTCAMLGIGLAAKAEPSGGAGTARAAKAEPRGGARLAQAADKNAPSAAKIARGKYLVGFGGCNDCHTPLKMTPTGPVPDLDRMLSGHPEGLVMPPAPALPPGPWMATVGATMTAWSGPWGTSFTANLTPDPETGLGTWTLKNFVETVRTGRRMGHGRPILPPMPYEQVASLTDDDLAAVFAYLKSIPPIRNRVPQPLPPAPAPVKTAAR